MSIQSEIDRISTAVNSQESLIGEIVTALAERCVVTEPILQARTVTPTEEVQVVTPDAGYDGLSSVTVEAAQGGEGTYGWKKSVSKLPSGYTEIEYIQSTGTQYINTGVSAPNGFRFTGKVNFTQTAADVQGIIGSYDNASPYYRNFFAAQGNLADWFIGAYGYSYFGSLQANTDYEIDVSTVSGNLYCAINGATQSLGFTPASSTRSSKSLYLFGLNIGSFACPAYVKLGCCKIYAGNNLVRDFIPCKNASGVAGLYDVVDGEFYTNAGSGTFTAGATTDSLSAMNTIGYVVSDDANAYPDREFLDGYYYEKL